MPNYYRVKYFFGKMKLKFGKMSNICYELLIYAHNEEEARQLTKIQANHRHGKSSDLEIVSVKPDY